MFRQPKFHLIHTLYPDMVNILLMYKRDSNLHQENICAIQEMIAPPKRRVKTTFGNLEEDTIFT